MNSEEEMWKPVVNFEGLYEISSIGRLKRLAGLTDVYKNGKYSHCVHRPTDTILKNTINYKGYMRNDLYKFINNETIIKRFCCLIHRLVAEAFIGKQPPGLNQINHKDGVKTNNHYTNLEWCNNSYNQKHANENGLIPPKKRGKDHFLSKEINQIDIKTGDIINTFIGIADVERITGINHKNIRKVCMGKRKSAGGYGWSYSSQN
jgi:hypothetical protein